MLTITLNKKAFEKKDEIAAYLEESITDLATSIDYDVMEGDFNCVDYQQDETFASQVMAVLARAIDEIVGF